MVHEHGLGVGGEAYQILELALADHGAGRERLALLRHAPDHVVAEGLREPRELGERGGVLLVRDALELDAEGDCAGPRRRGLDHVPILRIRRIGPSGAVSC